MERLRIDEGCAPTERCFLNLHNPSLQELVARGSRDELQFCIQTNNGYVRSSATTFAHRRACPPCQNGDCNERRVDQTNLGIIDTAHSSIFDLPPSPINTLARPHSRPLRMPTRSHATQHTYALSLMQYSVKQHSARRCRRPASILRRQRW